MMPGTRRHMRRGLHSIKRKGVGRRSGDGASRPDLNERNGREQIRSSMPCERQLSVCLESRHSAYAQIALIPGAKAGISAAQKIPIGGIWGRGPAHQGIE
jgi:hypothetical protein